MTTSGFLMEAVGVVAALATLTAFCATRMTSLRAAAMVANCAFICYGFWLGSLPVVLLHSVLLPLNAVRLTQVRRLTRHFRQASCSGLSLDSLKPYMKHRAGAPGEVLFKQGQKADAAYYIARGSVLLPELGKRFGPGTIFGEMGLFTSNHLRTSSAHCAEACELYAIPYGDLRALWFESPEFGAGLSRLMVRRFEETVPLSGAIADDAR